MRLIDADALEHDLVTAARYMTKDQVLDVAYRVNKAPTIDAVSVVRCKDCMYHFDVRMFGHQSVIQCAIFDYIMQPDSYCDQGRQEEDGE